MFKKIIQMVLGFICGYLFIQWLPITFPINISKLFIQYILDPIEFTVSTIVFILGFILNSKVIRTLIEQAVSLLQKQESNIAELILCSSIFIGFVFLFRIGLWQTVGFFAFSMIYGIISVDYRKFRLNKE